MSREIEQREIDGQVYQFQQFRTTVAVTVLSKVTKLFGEPIATAIGAVKGWKSGVKGLLGAEIGPDALSKAVKTLVENLDDPKTIALVQQLATEGVIVDGKVLSSAAFDFHYAGRLDHLVSVIQAQLEVQYGNFFDAISARLGPRTTPGMSIRQAE